MPGWTLTVDLPIEHGLDKLCDALDTEVVGSRRSGLPCRRTRGSARRPSAQMYPRLDDFLAVRREVDPTGIFNSDLARRLGTQQTDRRRCGMINAVGAPQSAATTRRHFRHRSGDRPSVRTSRTAGRACGPAE